MVKFLRKYKVAILCLIVIHLLYWIGGLILGNIYTEDSPEYLAWAKNFIDSQIFYSGNLSEEWHSKFVALRPPVYGIFIAICTSIISSHYFILIVQSILSFINCLLVLKLWESFFQKNYAWIVVVGYLLYPSLLIYNNMVMSELLFQCFYFWAFLQLIKFINLGNQKHFIFSQVLLILALFTKPVLLYFWIPNFLLCLYLFRTHRKAIVIFLPLLMPLLIALYCNYNKRQTGYYHFSSIKNINLVYFNAYQAVKTSKGTAYADSLKTEIKLEASELNTFKEKNNYLEQVGKGLILDNIFTYTYIHARGMLTFFVDPGRHDWMLYSGEQPKEEERISFFKSVDESGLSGVWNYLKQIGFFTVSSLIIIAMWNVILMICLVYFIVKVKVSVNLKILLTLFVGYIALFSVTIGASRFRIQIYPLLILVVPFVLSEIQNRFKLKTSKHESIK